MKQPSSTTPQLLAWDWGWNDAWTAEIIEQLPAGCALMSVSEWSLPIERGGVKSAVGEYSVSAIGPGPRAQRHWKLARQRGLRVIAKIQANNSWELSAVPFIPALNNVAEHIVRLRDAGVENLMLGWTLGGYPSPNLRVIPALRAVVRDDGETRTPPDAQVQRTLEKLAQQRVGPALAPDMLAAWAQFSRAFAEFPYHIGVVYSGPQQLGPANLLFGQGTGYHASMVGFPYDDLDAWRAVYPADTFIRQFQKVADGFQPGLDRLKQIKTGKLPAAQRDALAGDLRVAEAAQIHFRSVAHQARFVRARRALAAAKDASEAASHLAELESVLRGEIDLARRLHALQRTDSRLGFEASNQYYYVPADLVEKVLNGRDLLDRWLPVERRRWQAPGG